MKTYTLQTLAQFVMRADTMERIKIAQNWLYDHIEDEDDYRYLKELLATQKVLIKTLT